MKLLSSKISRSEEEAADPVAAEETRDLTDSIAAAAARKPGDGRSMMRVKTGPQMVRRKVPRWVGKLRCFFLIRNIS